MIKSPLELLKESIESTHADTPDAEAYRKAVLDAIETLIPSEIERCVKIYQIKSYDTTSNPRCDFYPATEN